MWYYLRGLVHDKDMFFAAAKRPQLETGGIPPGFPVSWLDAKR
jgi:hypothetical protein